MTSDLKSIGELLAADVDWFDKLVGLAGDVVVRNGDRTENGIVICGTCGCRRSSVVNGKTIACDCLCDKARYDAEAIAIAREAEKRERVERMREGIVRDYSGITFEKDDGTDAKTAGIARDYVENFETALEENCGLMFYGTPGGGKTFFAACIANALVEQGRSVLMTSVAHLVHEMQSNFEEKKNDVLRRVADVDLLVLDDVGVEANTAYRMEKLFEIIDTRANAEKPMLITTNTLTPDRLKNPANVEEQRIFSRLRGGMLYIMVNHKDRRDGQHYEKAMKMRTLLGL